MTITRSHNILRNRELHGQSFRKELYGSPAFVKSLDISHELDGHSGCVNALNWSEDGRYLASGSDDTDVWIWDSHAPGYEDVKQIKTGHRRNIFGVKFVPHTSSRRLVTCCGDREVRVFDVDYDDPLLTMEDPCAAHVYGQHRDRVKRISMEDNGHTFLTCSEDGDVRQWDMRIGGRSAGPPLASYGTYQIELHTLSLNAARPYLFAVGGSFPAAFLHDRRMTGRDMEREWGAMPGLSDASPTQTVRRFVSKDLRRRSGHITALKFGHHNPNELLVSFSQDSIYLYDILDDAKLSKEFELPLTENRPQAATDSPTGVKRKHDETIVTAIGDGAAAGPSAAMTQSARAQAAADSVDELGDENDGDDDDDDADAHDDFDDDDDDDDEDDADDNDGDDDMDDDEENEDEDGYLRYSYMYREVESDTEDDSDNDAVDGADETASLDRYWGTDPEMAAHRTRFFRMCDTVSRDAPVVLPRSRYVGHINVETVKDVNFYGLADEYVVSGSDNGNLLVWRKDTGEIVTVLSADDHVTNVVEPNPSTNALAASGIDSTVKIFEPYLQRYEIGVGEALDRERLRTMLEPSALQPGTLPSRRVDRPMDELLAEAQRRNSSDRAADRHGADIYLESFLAPDEDPHDPQVRGRMRDRILAAHPECLQQ